PGSGFRASGFSNFCPFCPFRPFCPFSFSLLNPEPGFQCRNIGTRRNIVGTGVGTPSAEGITIGILIFLNCCNSIAYKIFSSSALVWQLNCHCMGIEWRHDNDENNG
ncbi:MAG TPA: hypothetical protein PL157_17050, partial [Acidobacteriota bacterium]|nr:hypothetical protein [Acidobacteriota bacterium]